MPNDMSELLLVEVRAQMARRDVTRRSIADATDSDPATVGRWISGATSIRLRDLLTVCDLLGVTLEDLAHRALKNQDAA